MSVVGAAAARPAHAPALAVADVAGLTRRVAELEKVLEAMLRTQGIIAWLNDRIEALEQRPTVQYKGVYTDEPLICPAIWSPTTAASGIASPPAKVSVRPATAGPWPSSMAAMARMHHSSNRSCDDHH